MALGLLCRTFVIYADLPGDNRALEPPDSIPNSEVKRCIADGSVGFPHVRVGHRQASKLKRVARKCGPFLFGMRCRFFPNVEHREIHVTAPAPKVRQQVRRRRHAVIESSAFNTLRSSPGF